MERLKSDNIKLLSLYKTNGESCLNVVTQDLTFPTMGALINDVNL